MRMTVQLSRQFSSSFVFLFIISGLLLISRQAIAFHGTYSANGYPVITCGGYDSDNTGCKRPYQLFITPDDEQIKALSREFVGVDDVYNEAVKWVYVSEQTLNNAVEQWLTPRQFLTETSQNPANPLKGEPVSDCEEQANTLVSLLRAKGIPAEEVRVVLGRYTFLGKIKGHAWVELLNEGRWLTLDPSSGPYWDDERKFLVNRPGVPFDYYASYDFPVLQVEIYYNDIFYYEPGNTTGNVPSSWLDGSGVY